MKRFGYAWIGLNGFGQEVGYIWFNLQQFGLTWKILDRPSYVDMSLDLVGQAPTTFGQFWKGMEMLGKIWKGLVRSQHQIDLDGLVGLRGKPG